METITRSVIDRNALRHNFNELKNLISPHTEIMGIVKADAYGHGAVEVAKVAVNSGCSNLAVARFPEIVKLREAGIQVPILQFGYCSPLYVEYMIYNNARATIVSFESAEILNSVAVKLRKKLKVHIKIDTGMGRLGVQTKIDAIVQDVLKISKLSGLEIEGIYTHFANADARDKTHANIQFSIFDEILIRLKKEQFEVKYRHAANSAATIDMPETHLDIIRPGVAQYGLYPSNNVKKDILDLKPAMSLESTIIQIKDAPSGFKVSYGSTHITQKPTKIAVVPIGYADGYSRLLSSKGFMIVNGFKAPIIGRICMDLTMIDVGHIENINLGDKVTVMGTEGSVKITADDIAELAGTINYEIVSSITERVAREYIN